MYARYWERSILHITLHAAQKSWKLGNKMILMSICGLYKSFRLERIKQSVKRKNRV